MVAHSSRQSVPQWASVLVVLVLVAAAFMRDRHPANEPAAPKKPVETVSDSTSDGVSAPADSESSAKANKAGQRSKASDLASPRSIELPEDSSGVPIVQGAAEREARDKYDASLARGPPQPELGTLTEEDGGVKVSAAGLRYTRGSAEGHRLNHVLRHDNDQPDRPGKHGVFDGDSRTLLAVIDEGWLLVQKRDSRVKTFIQGNRTEYDINFGRRIGFIGGQEGREMNHPIARHLKLVVEGSNVITAFPY